MKRTRQEKYPNTSTFTYENSNPHGRITTDCVIRAITTATNNTYHGVIMDLAEVQSRTGYDMYDKKGFGTYLESLGWVKHAQPRKVDNTKFTGKEFCKYIQEHPHNVLNRIVADIGGHHVVAIIDGKIHDIWDSTDGCIGNYWTKG